MIDVSNFNEVNDLALRTFNRTVMMNNLMSDGGPTVAEEYASQFAPTEIKQMFIMNTYIKQVGEAHARKVATKVLSS